MNIRYIYWNGLIKNAPSNCICRPSFYRAIPNNRREKTREKFRSSSVGESTWLMVTSWIVQHRCFMSFGGDPKNNPPQNWDVSKGSWSKSGDFFFVLSDVDDMGSWQALPCLQLGCWPELVAQKSIFWVVSSYKSASFLAFFTFSRSLKHPHAYQDIKVHTYIQNASMNLLTWWSLILQKKLHLVFNFFLKFVDTCLYWF